MTARLPRHPLRVKLFKQLMRIAAAIQSIPARITPPPFRLMQMGSLFWQSRALYAATRLGVADALGDEAKDISTLAAELGCDEDHLHRLLRMLSALGVFERTASREFRNNKTSQYLRADHPQSVQAMILMHNSPEMTAPWLEPLEDAIRDGGIPFAKVHGTDLFSYMDRHEDFDLLFGRAMESVDSLTGNQYLDDFDWGAFDRLIDVGGSKGNKAAAILERHPRLTALVFDRPQIIEAGRHYWDGRLAPQVLGRMSFEGGDMLESLPAAQSHQDLYLFVAVFHGMGDSECLQVLHNLKTAIGDYAPCIVFIDMVMPEMQADPTTAAFDMQMLVNTRGRERTEAEWQALLGKGGFRLDAVIPVRTFASLIVARPAKAV